MLLKKIAVFIGLKIAEIVGFVALSFGMIWLLENLSWFWIILVLPLAAIFIVVNWAIASDIVEKKNIERIN